MYRESCTVYYLDEKNAQHTHTHTHTHIYIYIYIYIYYTYVYTYTNKSQMKSLKVYIITSVNT